MRLAGKTPKPLIGLQNRNSRFDSSVPRSTVLRYTAENPHSTAAFGPKTPHPPKPARSRLKPLKAVKHCGNYCGNELLTRPSCGVSSCTLTRRSSYPYLTDIPIRGCFGDRVNSHSCNRNTRRREGALANSRCVNVRRGG